jgi:hypothetical protein
MCTRCFARIAWCVLAAFLVAAAPSVPAEGIGRRPLPPPDAAAVARAKDGAARRLADAECQRVFSDFRDARGRTIEEDLAVWAMGPAEYLLNLPFIDGRGEFRCRAEKVMLASVPSVPRVIVCPGFARLQRDQPWRAEILVIHEVLHTLGLGEDPPSSAEITRRVEARCR